ncbi:MAG: DnaJ domain-containing protein [Alphaproteobacteria bacterium]|nr:DnaJ domain-containing protein [Alphaproteobacteria bacterium]MBT5655090.1 DnaJ domain-containing protein [Alphaproteobacteria bacterium]
MIRFLLIAVLAIAVLGGGFLLIKALVRFIQKNSSTFLKWSAAIGGGMLFLFFLLTGRLAGILYLIPLLGPLVQRLLMNTRFQYFTQEENSDTAAGPMTRSEALNILGLSENASKEDIKKAHRRLILSLHPDKGGSAYLAAKINQAREVLLKG